MCRKIQFLSLILLVTSPITIFSFQYEPCTGYPAHVDLKSIGYPTSLVPHNSVMYMAVSGNYQQDAFLMKQSQQGSTFIKSHVFLNSRNNTLLLSPDGQYAALMKKNQKIDIYKVNYNTSNKNITVSHLQKLEEKVLDINFNYNEKIINNPPYYSNTLFVEGLKADGITGFTKIYKLNTNKREYSLSQNFQHTFSPEWLKLSDNYMVDYTQGQYRFLKKTDKQEYSQFDNFTNWNLIYDMAITDQYLVVPQFEQHSMLPSKNYISVYNNTGIKYKWIEDLASQVYPGFSVDVSQYTNTVIISGPTITKFFEYKSKQNRSGDNEMELVEVGSIRHDITGFPIQTQIRQYRGVTNNSDFIAVYNRDKLSLFCPKKGQNVGEKGDIARQQMVQ